MIYINVAKIGHTLFSVLTWSSSAYHIFISSPFRLNWFSPTVNTLTKESIKESSNIQIFNDKSTPGKGIEPNVDNRSNTFYSIHNHSSVENDKN